MVNFVPTVAYYFLLNLPAAFTEPGARLLEEPCTSQKHEKRNSPENSYQSLVVKMANTPRTRRDRWTRLKRGISAVPWKFLFFELALPVFDIGSDIWAGFSYHNQGHRYWALSIWLLMLGPLVLAISSEVLQYLGRCIKKDATTSDNTDTILKFVGLVPLFQPFVHLYFAYKLQEAQKKMSEAKNEYKEVAKIVSRGVTQEQIKDLRLKVKSAAKKFFENKKKYYKLVTIFQGIRLYEIIGESGPQAALQLSIALRVGYISSMQVMGIVTRELPYI